MLDEDPYSYESYNKALKERQNHLSKLKAFKDYIEKQMGHIASQ